MAFTCALGYMFILPERRNMILRLVKTALLLAVALYYFLVVFNNLTDYNSHYQFVRHMLMMDTTFPGNRAMWRAVNSPAWHILSSASVPVCW